MSVCAVKCIDAGGGTTLSPLFEVAMLTCVGGCITVRAI